MCDQHQFFFEFDKAFTDQLIKKFEASPSHPLWEDVAAPLKGVYALYRRGKLTYAGKALDTTLKRRLAERWIRPEYIEREEAPGKTQLPAQQCGETRLGGAAWGLAVVELEVLFSE